MDVFHIPADIPIWALSLSDAVPRLLSESATRAEMMQMGSRSFSDTVTQNCGRDAATSGIFVGMVAAHALVNELVGFEKAMNVYSWVLRLGARSQCISVHISRNSPVRVGRGWIIIED